MEGVTILKLAIAERAKTIKIIQGGNYERKTEINSNTEKFNYYKKKEENPKKREEKGEKSYTADKQKKSFRQISNRKSVECWTCGKTGHFRSECSQSKGNSA